MSLENLNSETNYDFFAFISYSSIDVAAAESLQKQLESMGIPRDLQIPLPIGLNGKRRIQPVFRDVDDLGPTRSLTDGLQKNLAASYCLIVLCSPNAARSEYVKKEVNYFKSLGRSDRIFLALLSGAPTLHSQQNPEGAFFSELYGLDNSDADIHDPPKAICLKEVRSAYRREIQKLAASVLGLPPELFIRKREAELRKRRNQIAAIVVGCLALGGAAFLIQYFQFLAEQRQKQFERSARLAEHANEIIASRGDAAQAMALALAALPDKSIGKDTDYVPKAEAALLAALYANPLEKVLAGHESEIVSISVGINDSKIGSGSVDGSATIWKMSGENYVGFVLKRSSSAVLATTFGSKDRKFVTGYEDGSVKVWNTDTGEELFSVLHKGPAVELVLSPDESAVAAISRDGTATILDLENSKSVLLQHIEPDWKLNGSWGGANGTLWKDVDYSKAEISWGFSKPKSRAYRGLGVTAASWSQDGQLLFTSAQDGRIVTWNRLGKRIADFKTGYQTVFDFAIDHYTKHIIVGTVGGGSIWNVDGSKIADLLAPQWDTQLVQNMGLIQIEPLGKFAYLGHMQQLDGAATGAAIWSTEDGSVLAYPEFAEDFIAPVNAIKTIPTRGLMLDGTGSVTVDNNVLVTPGSVPRNLVRIQEQAKKYDTFSGHTSAITAVEISNDGTKFISGDQSGQIRIWSKRNSIEQTTISASRSSLVGMIDGDSSKSGSVISTVSADNYGRVVYTDEDDFKTWFVESGSVFVEDMVEGSAAARAGFLPEDIIKSINGKEIRATKEAFDRIAASPNAEMSIVVERGGRNLQLQLIPDEATTYNNNDMKQTKGYSGMRLRQLNSPDFEFTAVETAGSGRSIYFGSDNGVIQRFDLPAVDRNAVETLVPVKIGSLASGVIDLLESNDGGTIFAVSKSGSIGAWSVNSERWTHLADVNSSVKFARLSPDAKSILLALTDGEVVLVQTNYENKFRRVFGFAEESAADGAFSSDSNFVYLGGYLGAREGALIIYSVVDGTIERHSLPGAGPVTLADGGSGEVFVFRRDFSIQKIRASDGFVVATNTHYGKPVAEMISSQDGLRLYAFSDGLVRVYDSELREILYEWTVGDEGGAPLIPRVAALGDEDVVVSGSSNQIVVSRFPRNATTAVRKACSVLPSIYYKIQIVGVENGDRSTAYCD